MKSVEPALSAVPVQRVVPFRRPRARRRHCPGVMPILHLDHIYFEDSLEMESLNLHGSRRALMASDHLPLYATLEGWSRTMGHTRLWERMSNDPATGSHCLEV